MRRRDLLALAALALALPAAATAEEEEDCGCSAAKRDSSGRADGLYRRALASEDPQQRRRLLELAVRLDPDHQDARTALAESQ